MSHLLLSGQSCNGSFLLLKLSAKLRNPRYTLLIARLGHLGRTRGLADKQKVLSQLVNEVNQDRTQLTFHAPQGPQQHPKRNDSEHNEAMDPNIILHQRDHLCMRCRLCLSLARGASGSPCKLIASLSTSCAKVIRLNMIDSQTDCNVPLHARSYQVEQDHSSHDQGPSCLDTCNRSAPSSTTHKEHIC